ncbi:hypothetical protein [Hymenobacter metallicola]|uniref:Uncharacterized protein n=1 Tax=Hymenobacter metallicola TaxID=2563114 RepID=A0A4Z0QHS6_9BACT|nr:hypothetical protein [Hymenobacter metallicola]TGE28803.1 hypothetical protein E5K02_04905 [Hymenobacter metallicola]
MISYRTASSPSRKKARGGKRHLRRLQRASSVPGELQLATLRRQHYFYQKLGLGHWHHRQPPCPIRQWAVRHLLTTFFAWQRQLAALAEPAYCADWLVGPEFAHSSQVVVGIQERIAAYQNWGPSSDSDAPALPPAYYRLPGADRLAWEAHPWEVMYEADEYSEGWPQTLLRLPHREYQLPNRTFLAVQTGWVWVGQLPATA